MQFDPRTLLALVLVTCPAVAGCGLFGDLAHDDGLASLTVLNRSTFTVCTIEMSPTGRRRADTDAVARIAETIPPGGVFTLRVRAGRWDVGLEDCEGSRLLTRRDLLVRGRRRLEFDPPTVERFPRQRLHRMATRPGPASRPM